MGSRIGVNGKILAIGVVLLVLAGLGGYQLGLRAPRPGTLTASTYPTPHATGAATPSPSPVPTGPFRAVDPVHNAVVDALGCKLPVYLLGQQGTGGFINFPDGAATADSSSGGLHVPGGGTDWFGLAYDSVVKRWLPVPSAWVAPDGSIYAYMIDYDSHAGVNYLAVTNANTDSSGNLGSIGNGIPMQVIAVSSTNIYFAPSQRQGVYAQSIAGSFGPLQIGGGYWMAAFGPYVYGSTIPDGGAVVRVDVTKPSQVVSWFNVKSNTAQIIGFDGAGNPLIWTGTELWIATAPDKATSLGPLKPQDSPVASSVPIRGAVAPVTDSHGTWISTQDGIYLLAGGKATKVSNQVAQVAGPCI